VVGSALQLGVQLPAVLSLVQAAAAQPGYGLGTRPRGDLKNFAPVFLSRGVVQISAYVDQVFASLLGTGAVAALTNAQTLYTLPVSLFGMSISAAELPAMSSALGPRRDGRRSCGSGSIPACGGSPFSWCRRRWLFWRSAA
jgi:putative peptidoglycan lipid II flippase